MRTCLCDHGLSLLQNGKDLLFSFGSFCSCGLGLALASMLTVALMSTGCDPKAPPTEDLGTVLNAPPVVAESDVSDDIPENVVRRMEDADRKKAEQER